MRRILLLPLAVLALAACGGGGSPSSGVSPAATTAAPATTTAAPNPAAQTVAIHETEFKLDPAQLTVRAGAITFNLMGEGKFPHDLHIAPKGTTNEVAGSQRMRAGGMTTFTATLRPGAYDMWCAVEGHRQQGMQGTITVT